MGVGAKLWTCGLVLAGSLGATAVSADAIDGEWCAPDGQRSMQIAGPRIVTSSGVDTLGDYSRHAFAYTLPAGQEGAGGEVRMQLLNDDEVRVAGAAGAPEIWRRCKPIA